MHNLKKCLLMMMILSTFILAACNADDENKQEETTFKDIIQFDSKISMRENDDGWLYYFLCEYSKDTSKPYAYIFDGYNLKYKQIEGFEIKVTDKNGVLLDKISPKIPYLLAHDDYQADILAISDFFEKLAPATRLEEKDLDGLELKIVDKGLLLELYNECIESEPVITNKYYDFPQADMVQDKLKDGYVWQVSYFMVKGVIKSINIELIYDGGIYLTDLVAANSGNGAEVKMAKEIEKLEDIMISKCSLVPGELNELDIPDDKLDRLVKLLQEIEESY